MAEDLTRWNRAGLTRFRYIDGNAATYLEYLRGLLAERFPAWGEVQAVIPADETEAATKQRLEDQYAQTPGDLLAALLRTFARATHILTETADAYANEAYLGTATQWDNVRKLVEMLDYHPSPPASAFTTLLLNAKEGQSGVVSTGFQIKYAPATGDPVVFETLADLTVDSTLNALHPSEYLRNPARLGGHTLALAGKVEDLKTGEPLVLEDERNGNLLAYIIQGVAESDDATTVTVNPPLSHQFASGYTLVHAVAKDKLSPLAPKASGAVIARSLQLTGPTTGLQAGDVVIVGSPGKKPFYQRLRYVEPTRLVFTEDLGELDLDNATVSQPVTLAVAQHGQRSTSGGSVLGIVYAAGDWTRLAGLWAADSRLAGTQKVLPMYEVMTANYVAAGTSVSPPPANAKAGFTALTLRWNQNEDRVSAAGEFYLNNPQTLLVPPVSPGPWQVDAFLQKSSGHLPSTVVTNLAKKAAAGDLAVVVEAGQAAWCRLQSVANDLQHGQSQLRAQGGWQDRGGGPFYLTRTTVYAHFQTQARVLNWTENDTAITGKIVPVAAIPAALAKGRVLVAQSNGAAVKTTVAQLHAGASPPQIILADDVPDGSTVNSLVLGGNAVPAGHGETRSERVLGSGDATQLNMSFLLPLSGISFVADASQPSGVAAAMDVKVDGVIWNQVGNLKDSGPADIDYTVRMTEDGYVTIGFGDGVNGRRLPTGTNNVRVQFRQGVGAAGNLSVGSLVKPVKPHRLLESTMPVSQPLPASGGADMEGVESLRTDAPATVLTLERAVSLDDFALLMRANSSVAQARAFSLPTGFGQRENIEVVVIPAGGAAFTPDLAAALESYALTAALPGVQVKASAYEPVIVSFSITIRVITAEFDGDAVAAEVRSQLASAFALRSRGLGQALYQGDLFKVVEGVEGVENSDCVIQFNPVGQALTEQPQVVAGPDGMIRMLRPGDRQCLHLDPVHPVVDVTVQEYSL